MSKKDKSGLEKVIETGSKAVISLASTATGTPVGIAIGTVLAVSVVKDCIENSKDAMDRVKGKK